MGNRVSMRVVSVAGVQGIRGIDWATNLLTDVRPESQNSNEHGNMKKRIQVLEDGRVPARREDCWN